MNVESFRSQVARDLIVNLCKLCLFIQLKLQGGHSQCNRKVSWDLLYLPTCKYDTTVEFAETEKLLLLSLKNTCNAVMLPLFYNHPAQKLLPQFFSSSFSLWQYGPSGSWLNFKWHIYHFEGTAEAIRLHS